MNLNFRQLTTVKLVFIAIICTLFIIYPSSGHAQNNFEVIPLNDPIYIYGDDKVYDLDVQLFLPDEEELYEEFVQIELWNEKTDEEVRDWATTSGEFDFSVHDLDVGKYYVRLYDEDGDQMSYEDREVFRVVYDLNFEGDLASEQNLTSIDFEDENEFPLIIDAQILDYKEEPIEDAQVDLTEIEANETTSSRGYFHFYLPDPLNAEPTIIIDGVDHLEEIPNRPLRAKLPHTPVSEEPFDFKPEVYMGTSQVDADNLEFELQDIDYHNNRKQTVGSEGDINFRDTITFLQTGRANLHFKDRDKNACGEKVFRIHNDRSLRLENLPNRLAPGEKIDLNEVEILDDDRNSPAGNLYYKISGSGIHETWRELDFDDTDDNDNNHIYKTQYAGEINISFRVYSPNGSLFTEEEEEITVSGLQVDTYNQFLTSKDDSNVTILNNNRPEEDSLILLFEEAPEPEEFIENEDLKVNELKEKASVSRDGRYGPVYDGTFLLSLPEDFTTGKTLDLVVLNLSSYPDRKPELAAHWTEKFTAVKEEGLELSSTQEVVGVGVQNTVEIKIEDIEQVDSNSSYDNSSTNKNNYSNFNDINFYLDNGKLHEIEQLEDNRFELEVTGNEPKESLEIHALDESGKYGSLSLDSELPKLNVEPEIISSHFITDLEVELLHPVTEEPVSGKMYFSKGDASPIVFSRTNVDENRETHEFKLSALPARRGRGNEETSFNVMATLSGQDYQVGNIYVEEPQVSSAPKDLYYDLENIVTIEVTDFEDNPMNDLPIVQNEEELSKTGEDGTVEVELTPERRTGIDLEIETDIWEPLLTELNVIVDRSPPEIDYPDTTDENTAEITFWSNNYIKRIRIDGEPQSYPAGSEVSIPVELDSHENEFHISTEDNQGNDLERTITIERTDLE